MLWPYALASVSTVKAALGIQDSKRDAVIENAINEASQLVEQAWGRHVVSRGELTEYHTYACPPLANSGSLYLNEWPIVSVTNVYEDPNRAFATALVVNTDYIVSKPAGKLLRVSSATPMHWQTGWRAIKVVYLGGYQNTNGTITSAEAVPPTILRVFYEMARWIINQRTANEVGLTQVQDSFGNRTFSGPAYITPGMQAALYAAGAVASTLAGRTGERDV